MAFTNDEISCLTTANYEARHLIAQSCQLRRQVLDIKLGLKEGIEMPTEGKGKLEESIRLAWQVLEIDPDSPDLAFYYMTLAHSTRLMDDITGELDAGIIDEVVYFSKLAVEEAPEEKSEFRARLLHDFARALHDRYERQGSPDDLEEAIQVTGTAMETTNGNLERVTLLELLVQLLFTRYMKTRTSDSLEETIRAVRQGILETTKVNSERLPFQHNLARLLMERYTKIGGLHDLDEAIILEKQAIQLIPDISDQTENKHEFGLNVKWSRHSMLQFLVEILLERYKKTGVSDDVQDAVLFGKQAVELMPDTPDKLHVSTALSVRSDIDYSDPSADVEGTIALLNQVINLSVDGLDEVYCVVAAGIHATDNPRDICRIDEYIRSLEYLIETKRDKVAPAKVSMMLSMLSSLLLTKYIVTGRVVNLNQCLVPAEEAVDNIASYDPEDERIYKYCIGLASLGFSMSSFSQSRLSPDFGDQVTIDERATHVEKAIMYAKEFVDMLPENDSVRAVMLGGLSDLRSLKHDPIPAATSSEDIRAAREVLSAAPGNYPIEISPSNPMRILGVDVHPLKGMYLANLALKLQEKYMFTGEIGLLDEAIQVLERTSDSGISSNVNIGTSQNSLAFTLFLRYFHTNTKVYLESAITQLRTVLHDTNLCLLERIWSSELLFFCCPYMGRDYMDELYQDAVLAISLIPKLMLESRNSDVAQILSTITIGVASKAAALALEIGKEPFVAVEFLESGRGILAASLEDLRAYVPDLQANNPLLADRLSRMQKELRNPASPRSIFHLCFSYAASFDRRDSTEQEYNALVDEIRQLPGFESALGVPRKADVLEAAKDGPIAVINVSDSRCDAILVEQDRVWNLPLPRLRLDDVKKRKARSSGMGRSNILEWLWDTIACPVLHALGFDQPLPDKHLRRIWWIPTGPLNGFPLHAAGYHGRRNSETVIDRVMSSYSSSIKAIINSRRRRTTSQLTPGRALLVAMPQTPGHSALRHSIEEVSKVRDICNSMSLNPIDLQMPHKQEVLQSLTNCTVFHFSGHGYTDPSNPFDSKLYLHDWRDNPLRVSDILDLNLCAHTPFLAYLAACGTGHVKNEGFLDENIHLIRGFQLSGFRHVIGTLWEADDEWSVDVAKIVYEGMRDGGLTDESVCRGMHNASRVLRDRWIDNLGLEDQGTPSKHTNKPIPYEEEPMDNTVRLDSEENLHRDWESVMERKKEFLKGTFAYGMVKSSGASRQTRTVSRRGSALDSAVTPSVLPVINTMDSLTIGRELNRCLRKVEIDETDNGEGGANGRESPLWVPFVHFGV
ncbi:CHAT domain-containing protein [Xylaria telfairii]|nr:CHAT domain-containing protein [Xylaria telfairii]